MNRPRTVIAVDGEGLTRSGRHDYCLLSAWTREREVATVEQLAPGGLSTADCLGLLTSLPQDGAIVVGFSLGYDQTMWLRGLTDTALYSLCHPETRRGRFGPKPLSIGALTVQQGTAPARVCTVKANLVGRRLAIRIVAQGEHRSGGCRSSRGRCDGCKVVRRVTVWDVFTFFQTSFVKACHAWGVISTEERDYLVEMKEARSRFTEGDWTEIRRYCGLECQRLAEMVSRVIEAHDRAGLPLRTFYGAGSSAAAWLDRVQAKTFMYQEGDKRIAIPERMTDAVARAFNGGRFEVARIGTIAADVFSDDIASAYPYATCFLPCLVHGKWRHVKRARLADIERADAALVRYRLPPCDAIKVDRRNTRSFYPEEEQEHATSPEPWGPLPFRTKRGCIVYPVTSGGGWAWKQELLPAMRFAPNVETSEAWLYHTECSCSVFREAMPALYKTRLQWGKDGPGLVAKLGANACTGKFSQSRGAAPYQNWVWAGIVMATTRGQLLDAMMCASDRRKVLATATDSIFALERLALPSPHDTQTSLAATAAGKVPLGAWEPSAPMQGIHLVKPGILFPLRGEALDADGEAKTVKARGIGKKLLAEERERVLASWKRHGPKPFTVRRPAFFGMKASLHPSGPRGDRRIARSDNFGTWDETEIEVSYITTPKRPFAEGDGTLHTWALGVGMVSAPYDRSIVPPHVDALKRERDLEADQPDADDGLDDVDAL